MTVNVLFTVLSELKLFHPVIKVESANKPKKNSYYYLCARNLSTQRFSLDKEKSEKHIHHFFALSVGRLFLFLNETDENEKRKKTMENNERALALLRLQHILYMRPLYDNKHIQIM